MVFINTKSTKPKSKCNKLDYGDGSVYYVKSRKCFAGQITLEINGEKNARRLTVKPNALLRISCLNIVFRQKQDFLTNPITQLSMSLPKR